MTVVSVSQSSDALSELLPSWVSLTLYVEYLFASVPAKRSLCSLPWTCGVYSRPLTGPVCLDLWIQHSRFLCRTALYHIGASLPSAAHPQPGVVLLWLCLFSLFGVFSPLISSSILGATELGSSYFMVLSFFLFILFMEFSRQEY